MMNFINKIIFFLITASLTLAVPNPSRQKRAEPGQANIDEVIFQYALTLEYLENAFYRDALPSQDAFRMAGYPNYVWKRFKEIGGHEKSHVATLSKVLGDKATKECKYNFGVTGPKSFIATAQLLEGVGTSAYLGALRNITDPFYMLAAASITTTEARHSSWVQASAGRSDGFGAAYDTPTDFNQTYSLAAHVITSCPDSNPKLPVIAFPSADFMPMPTKLGQTVKVDYKNGTKGDKVGFIGGYGAASFADIMDGNMVTLPKEVTYGRTYAVVVKGSAKEISDDCTVAGPVAFDILPTPDEALAHYKRSM